MTALSVRDTLPVVRPLRRSDTVSDRQLVEPIVIVGNGPVGMRFAADVLKLLPDRPVVIYGEESNPPYNRVKLSSWLAGEVRWNDLVQPLKRPFGTRCEELLGYRVEHIDTDNRIVRDSSGAERAYSKLVLATGSRAFVPPVPGMDAEGVYTLRNLDDANRLFARRVRSHHTVVIGGGLLGLEAARAMQPLNTCVTIIEHADRLMSQQLDTTASEQLMNKVGDLGMSVVLGDGIKSILASPRVTGITLQSGRVIECDTVVVATGIRPNIDLAISAGLFFGRGITVNDQMQTSDSHIYAIGECAEHRREVYGLVAPGLEQASVAASHIAGQAGQYSGSTAVSRLKVVGTSVFSMGPMGETAHPLDGRKYCFIDGKTGVYRALLVRHNRLIGAIGIGEWPETLALQSAILDAKRVNSWELWRFKRTGKLLAQTTASAVAAWPSSTTVCQCMGVKRGCLSQAIANGAGSVEEVQKTTSAATVCGSCKPLIQELLGSSARRSAATFSTSLLVLSCAAMMAMGVVTVFPELPYASTIRPPSIAGITLSQSWDVLWREGIYRQVSGFTLLGLSLIATVLTFRKRTQALRGAGRFDIWRLVHVVSGVLAIGVLMLHTGFRTGYGLNQWLMLCFVGLIVLGSVGSAVVSLEHRLDTSLAMKLRRKSIWLHILLFIPVPVLLGWHVFKGYWY